MPLNDATSTKKLCILIYSVLRALHSYICKYKETDSDQFVYIIIIKYFCIVRVSAHLSHHQGEPNTRKTGKKSLRYTLPRMCNYCMHRILQQVLYTQYKSLLKIEKLKY